MSEGAPEFRSINPQRKCRKLAFKDERPQKTSVNRHFMIRGLK
jgi:hypothetical protein